ncbi:tRNA(His) guanylyltransferase Thg1 family protein [Flammeovirga sp. OC4]|uniref:tRNA(His) guanylyltransferase Thg1 family protein n=1 Tax=Flammeovirga sp. OC4 TaxID=1382345 RepID=UPI0005C55AD2|nr:tRNA(His) guanylyltransferase Thg1 family protein [Flammeovirga sp. OC4]
MKFDNLDKKLRVFETAYDFSVPPNNYMVARIDGRGFTRLTKEVHSFERPFDVKFRDLMVETVKHLMTCGFHVIYAYTESDEISLLFDINENAFSRKSRKYTSILAGEASAKFSLLLGALGTFDCRLSILPRVQDVVDYFRWRHEDAHRNALNAHCYWMLRNQGQTPTLASKAIEKKSTKFKNELLFQNGINFNDLPSWQKRGIGFYWTTEEKTGWNPKLNREEVTKRKVIKTEFELELGQAYSNFVADKIKRDE